MSHSRKLRVLFLCTGNSCRSQMAEGWTRRLHGERIEVHSAGIEAHGLNPNAVRVMDEAGVDIRGQRSKTVDELPGVELDWVVTVCDHAHEHCPVLPGRARLLHAGFDDPPRLAAGAANEEEALGHYRRVRDEIRAFVAGLPETLGSVPPLSKEGASRGRSMTRRSPHSPASRTRSELPCGSRPLRDET